MKSLSFNLDDLKLQRFLSRKNVDSSLKIIKIAIVIFIFILFIFLIFKAVNAFLNSSAAISKLESDVDNLATLQDKEVKKNPLPANYKLIEDNKIFGELGSKDAAPAAAVTKPVEPLSIELIGTYVDDEKSPYAIIEDKKKKTQEVFVINENVFDQGKVKSIVSDKVEVDRNGEIIVLRLDDTPEDAPQTKDGIASLGNNEYVVDEAEVDKALENLPLLLTQARAVPYFEDGKAIGLRLFAIRSASLYEKIGLRNGDILKSINGSSLADLTQAMKLFEKLKEEKSLGLTLKRNNEDMDFKYQVK